MDDATHVDREQEVGDRTVVGIERPLQLAEAGARSRLVTLEVVGLTEQVESVLDRGLVAGATGLLERGLGLARRVLEAADLEIGEREAQARAGPQVARLEARQHAQ